MAFHADAAQRFRRQKIQETAIVRWAANRSGR
jgi:hypothetical protein